ESLRQQSIARHGKPNSRLTKLEDQNGRNHPHQCAEENAQANPSQAATTRKNRKLLESVHDGCSIIHHRLPRNQASERNSDSDVQNRAHNESGNNPGRNIALRVAGFLCGSRDRVKSDVSKENDGSAGEHAGPTIWEKWMVILRFDEL